MSTSTAPGRPVVAIWNASAMTRGDVVTVADQEVVLGDRHRDAGDVGFLEGVGADQGTTDLPGDRDDGDRVHLGVGQRGDQVGGAWTRGGHHHTDLAGGVRVTAGRMTGALLVADQHVTQLLRVEQRVVDGQHRSTWNAEDDVDVELLQRPNYRLRARQSVAGQRVFGCEVGVFAGPVLAGVPFGAVRRLRWSRGGCAHDVLLVSLRCSVVSIYGVLGQQKTPVSSAAARGLRVDACRLRPGYAPTR